MLTVPASGVPGAVSSKRPSSRSAPPAIAPVTPSVRSSSPVSPAEPDTRRPPGSATSCTSTGVGRAASRRACATRRPSFSTCAATPPNEVSRPTYTVSKARSAVHGTDAVAAAAFPLAGDAALPAAAPPVPAPWIAGDRSSAGPRAVIRIGAAGRPGAAAAGSSIRPCPLLRPIAKCPTTTSRARPPATAARASTDKPGPWACSASIAARCPCDRAMRADASAGMPGRLFHTAVVTPSAVMSSPSETLACPSRLAA